MLWLHARKEQMPICLSWPKVLTNVLQEVDPRVEAYYWRTRVTTNTGSNRDSRHQMGADARVASSHWDAFDCYTEAHRISSRGRVRGAFRGGCEEHQMTCVCVCGWVGCVCVPFAHWYGPTASGTWLAGLPSRSSRRQSWPLVALRARELQSGERNKNDSDNNNDNDNDSDSDSDSDSDKDNNSNAIANTKQKQPPSVSPLFSS